ncbi:MAG: GNAT family N-acetyltransferase [Myxococcales bacterium]|nr:GNAT family N-acetyltransferase [Myxococcales bacterium]
MEIRQFRSEDAPALATLSSGCARGESDFVLNPFWETEDELFAEFDRFGIRPEDHLLVADAGEGEVLGLAGFLRLPGARTAGMFCPIVNRGDRGRGRGGELLRAAQSLGREKLGLELVSAAIGTRNRAGYSLLTSHGFRPVRQHFLMRCDERPTAPPPPIADVVLEAAKPEDADAILEVYATCGFEERSVAGMAAVLADGRHWHAVARQAGRVVAFAEIETHWPRRVWVAYVGVAAELRDRGLGSTLVAWSLERQFEAGAKSALLMLSPANRTALRAYEKVGFRRHRLADVLEKRL